MKKIILSFSVLTLFTSCSLVERNIASRTFGPPPLTDMVSATETILQDIESPEFNQSCVSYLKKLGSKLDLVNSSLINKNDSEKISKKIWEIRKNLHNKLVEVDKSCAHETQSIFRQFRQFEDHLLESTRSVTHLNPSDIDFQKQPIPMIDTSHTFYDLKISDELKFLPGDILITRGVSFLSGMIARIGKRSTQFSHVVMIHEDPETKELKTIESYVGIGVSFYDFKFALKNENARILWLRPKDKNIGNLASQMMGKIVSERLSKNNPIKYDYELDFNNPERMSCAEVSQVAFTLADKNFLIPYYPNEIIGAQSIIDRLRLTKGETYAPGDMEIDPRFELMGEFKDLRLTRDSRQKDAIMTSIFDWMESKNYYLKDNLKSRMAGSVIYRARKTFVWPVVKRFLKLQDFSKEIPANMIQTLSIVNELGDHLLEKVKLRDEVFEKKNGMPMNFSELMNSIEELRKEDLLLYQSKSTRKNAKIHKLIRPSK